LEAWGAASSSSDEQLATMAAMMPAQSNPFANRENIFLVVPGMGINSPGQWL